MTTSRVEEISVDGPAYAVAVGEGAIWVAIQPGEVVRIDPATSSVIGTQIGEQVAAAGASEGLSLGAIAAGEGALWVVGIDSYREGHLVRIDPTSEATTDDPIRVARGRHDFAFTPGWAWLSSERDGVLFRIHPRSSESARLVIDGRALAIAADGGRLWVAHRYTETELTKLSLVYPSADEAAGEQIRPGLTDAAGNPIGPGGPQVVGEPLPASFTSEIAVAAGSIWTSGPYGGVTRIDPATGAELQRITVSESPTRLAVADRFVCAAVFKRDSVVLIDAESGDVTERIAVGEGPSALAVGEGSVWVANQGATVSRIVLAK